MMVVALAGPASVGLTTSFAAPAVIGSAPADVAPPPESTPLPTGAVRVPPGLTPVSADAASDAPDSTRVAPPADRVDVYYLHWELRCESCLKTEAYTSELVQDAFGGELSDGRMTWRVVNLDDGNECFVELFDLDRASLVLADIRSDTLAGFRVLESTWDLVGEKALLTSYVEDEIRASLADAAGFRRAAAGRREAVR